MAESGDANRPCKEATIDMQTPPPPSGADSSSPGPAADEESCLLAATRLDDFMTFIRERTVDGGTADRGELAQWWRDAAAHHAQLQTTQAGLADHSKVLPLPPQLQAHVRKLLKTPSFQTTFSTVPVAFGMVELDKLVVYQQYLTHSSLHALQATVAQAPGDAELAALCLPLTAPATGLRLVRQEGDRYVFVADGHDGRFLGAQLVEPSRIRDLAVSGHASCVLALPLGFTTNVLNVVRYGPRMVLNNGYHRAAVLLRSGVTHAPCIIQVCAHWEDVAIAGAGAIYRNGDSYFTQPRPPMLRDFFDPLLTRTFRTWRLRKEIRVSFQVDTVKLAI